MSTDSIRWYDENAAAYFDETAHLDSSSILDGFLSQTLQAAPILDIGCGSGRDLKAMRARGFNAAGLEPAAALAELATAHSGSVVYNATVQNAKIRPGSLGGAWACSSLLHVEAAELPWVFQRIRSWLMPGGLFYTCFKDGAGQTVDARGRRFTNLRLDQLGDLTRSAGFEIVDLWASETIVPGRTQTWNNVLARKPRPA